MSSGINSDRFFLCFLHFHEYTRTTYPRLFPSCSNLPSSRFDHHIPPRLPYCVNLAVESPLFVAPMPGVLCVPLFFSVHHVPNRGSVLHTCFQISNVCTIPSVGVRELLAVALPVTERIVITLVVLLLHHTLTHWTHRRPTGYSRRKIRQRLFNRLDRNAVVYQSSRNDSCSKITHFAFPNPIAVTHSAATTASRPNKSFRQSSPRSAITRTQRFRLSVSFVVTQPAFKPSHRCTDLCDVLVHHFDAVVERFSILLTLAQFSREPQPHFTNRPA